MDNITNFLYLIGSVFAPMIAIQITDFFLLKEDYSEKKFRSQYGTVGNRLILYRILMKIEHPGRQYTAGYCDHGGTVSDLGKNQQKEIENKIQDIVK